MPARMCLRCGLCADPSRMLVCRDCRGHFHRSCLQLRQHAYAGTVFQCPDCLLWEAKIPGHPQAVQLAADVLYLESSRLASSTDGTYHSALNRFRRFVAWVLGVPIDHALPLGPGQLIPVSQVKLFLAEGRHHYSVSSLQHTLTVSTTFTVQRGCNQLCRP